jgi:hypothetical protein
MKMVGQPRIDLQLRGWGTVGHVVDPWIRPAFREPDKRPGGIVAVNLIDPARPVSFQDRFAGKKLSHKDRATGSVKSGKSRDQAARIQRNCLSLQQNSTGFSMGSGFAGFINPRAVGLSVDGCASGEEHLPW